MKKLPLGIQSFREIINGNYVYVDKTQFVYDLINNAKYYFLSRPRRFGKSLLLDTIGEAFSGDKELFKGLRLYSSDYDFVKHPVLRLDMSRIANETPEILKASVASKLIRCADEENIGISDKIPSDIFGDLIESLYKKYRQSVVVLIDEYDKPILSHIDDIKIAEANRKVLRDFYGILKSMDPYLRLTFVTGVSKFTKTSIFSELNNLLDITLNKKYSNICGISAENLDEYFGQHIEYLAALDDFEPYGDLRGEILTWYDGYSWDGKTRVINPFSLLSFFSQERFANFWYASGTPKFLIDIIKKDPAVYTSLKNTKITELMLDTSGIEVIEPELMFFQTGYLTIKSLLPVKGAAVYQLDMPNFEVSEAFNLQIISAFTKKRQARVKEAQLGMDDALQRGDTQKILEILRSLFASIPYQLHIDLEAYYHSIFFAVMSVLGFNMDAEVSTSKGRVDAVLELDDKVYVMEFKYEGCAPDADHEVKRKLFDKALAGGMKQIQDRGYHKKYLGRGKEIILASFAFLGRDDIEMLIEFIN